MKQIWDIFYPKERRMVVQLLAILVVVSLLELTGLVLVIPYVELMLDETNVTTYVERFPILTHLLEIAGDYRISISICFAGFYVLKNGLLGGFAYLQQTILMNIKANIMNRMFHFYMHQPYSFHLNARSSDLVRTITYDTTLFTQGVLQQSMVLISELLLLAGVLIFLAFTNPLALLVFVVMIIPVIIVYLLIRRRMFLWGVILQKRESNVIKHVQEGMSGIKDSIVLGVQENFENTFRDNVNYQVKTKRNRDVVVQAPRFIIETFMMITMAVALYWLSKSGGLQSNIATIAFLAIVSVRILPMSNRILNGIAGIRSAMPSTDVVYGIARPKPHVPTNLTDGNGISSNPFLLLSIDGVTFGYSSDQIVLNNVNMDVSCGETLGIVGGSGSGKTTLVDLILGLLPPNSGRILCNKENILDNLSRWQQRIGYVQQNVYLIDATIGENIAYGIQASKIDTNRVEEVLIMAKLNDWVRSLPETTDSLVGERGVRISGGQRQRIGIARALYHNPELLVLDEATSSLDNATEKQIMDDVYSMHGDRTIIMIAHRLETIKQCDRIIVLEQGKIVDSGTYDTLVKSSTSFQNISNTQGNVQ